MGGQIDRQSVVCGQLVRHGYFYIWKFERFSDNLFLMFDRFRVSNPTHEKILQGESFYKSSPFEYINTDQFRLEIFQIDPSAQSEPFLPVFFPANYVGLVAILPREWLCCGSILVLTLIWPNYTPKWSEIGWNKTKENHSDTRSNIFGNPSSLFKVKHLL